MPSWHEDSLEEVPIAQPGHKRMRLEIEEKDKLWQAVCACSLLGLLRCTAVNGVAFFLHRFGIQKSKT